MKVSKQIRDLYNDNIEIQSPLKAFVDDIANSVRINHPSWHYISRLKSEESFALKLEMGRGYISKQQTIEDFFACTFVVEHHAAIQEAYSVIEEHFHIQYQRPPKDQPTKKSPESFSFDDLRLYCTVQSISNHAFKNTVFEIQIKTFLQHAWGIATHDLTYKGADVSWGTHRIAFQIKAMLEHAEVSIQQAKELANCDVLNKTTSDFSISQEINRIISKHWDKDNLPTDKKRLIDIFSGLLKSLKKNPSFLEETLDFALKKLSQHPSNLSPYSTFIQYLIWYDPKVLVTFSSDKKYKKDKIFMDPNLEIPENLNFKDSTYFTHI